MPSRFSRLAIAIAVFAGALSASTEVERVAKLGEVWFKAKHFHPYLAYRDVDWRGALQRAIPLAREAKTPEEFAAAVNQLLAILGDPATRVEPPAGAGGAAQVSDRQLMHWKKQPDGVLIAGLNAVSVAMDVGESRVEFGNLMREIRSAKGLVLDLRLPPAGQPARDTFLQLSDRLVSLLITAPLSGPGRRRLVHHGLQRADLVEAGYYTAFETTSAAQYQPFADSKGPPAVFVLNRHSPWPPFIQAMVAARKALVVFDGDGRPDDAPAVMSIPLEAGWVASVRIEEWVFPDGTSSPEPNVRVKEGEGLSAALPLLGQMPAPAKGTQVATAPIFRDAYWSINSNQRFPEVHERLAAVFQLWGIIEYFYPHRAQMGVNWSGVLKEFIPRVEDAKDEVSYYLAIAEMCAFIKDSHLEMPRSSVVARLFFPVPVQTAEVRMVEGKPVIWRAGQDATGLHPGDIVRSVDGEDAEVRLKRLRKYISASTEQSMQRHLARTLLSGVEGTEAKVEVENAEGERRSVTLTRKLRGRQVQDGNPSPPARMLEGEIAYLDLSRVTAGELERTLMPFTQSKALILDLRRGGAFPQYDVLRGLLAIRGGPAFVWRTPVLTGAAISTPAASEHEQLVSLGERDLRPAEKPIFTGRIAVLVDEYAQSALEALAQMLGSFCGARLIGGPTTGANGNSTNFVLPGGMQVGITGVDLRYRTPAGEVQQQRVGVKPDIAVAPTILGVRQGRDEVLERAIAFARNGQ